MRVVADEGHSLGVVANGVAHAAERRAGDCVDEARAHEGPRGDQVVNLDLRPKSQSEHAENLRPVGRDAFLAAEERAQDERARADELGEAERDHRKGRAAALGRGPAEEGREEETGSSTKKRHEEEGNRQSVGDDDIDDVHRAVGAEPVVDRVTERQHPGLAEQHVVGQREQHGDAHQAHHGQRSSRAEHERGEHQQKSGGEPPAPGRQPRLSAARQGNLFKAFGRHPITSPGCRGVPSA